MRNTEAFLIGIILFAGTLPALDLSFLYGNPWMLTAGEYVKAAGLFALGAFFLKTYRGKEYALVVLCYLLSVVLSIIPTGDLPWSIGLQLLAQLIFAVLLTVRPLRDGAPFSWQFLAHYGLTLVLLFQAGAVWYFQVMQTDADEVAWLPKINIAVMGLISLIKFNESPLGPKANYEAALLNMLFVYAFLGIVPFMAN